MRELTAFHKNLTICRILTGIKRQALADALQLPVTTVAGYEMAGHEPRFKTLLKIAKFFDVTADELVCAPLKNETMEKLSRKGKMTA